MVITNASFVLKTLTVTLKMTISSNMVLRCIDVLGIITLMMVKLNVTEKLKMKTVLQDIKKLFLKLTLMIQQNTIKQNQSNALRLEPQLMKQQMLSQFTMNFHIVIEENTLKWDFQNVEQTLLDSIKVIQQRLKPTLTFVSMATIAQ